MSRLVELVINEFSHVGLSAFFLYRFLWRLDLSARQTSWPRMPPGPVPIGG